MIPSILTCDLNNKIVVWLGLFVKLMLAVVSTFTKDKFSLLICQVAPFDGKIIQHSPDY